MLFGNLVVRQHRWGRALRAALLIIASSVASNRIGAQTTSVPSGLRTIVYRNAPFIIQETRFDPVERIDHILPVDFDGDVYAQNNVHSSDVDYVVDGAPKIYFSAVETGDQSDRMGLSRCVSTRRRRSSTTQ